MDVPLVQDVAVCRGGVREASVELTPLQRVWAGNTSKAVSKFKTRRVLATLAEWETHGALRRAQWLFIAF